MMKKYVSLFLVLVMLVSCMPLPAFAEGDAQETETAQTEPVEEKADPAEEKAEEPTEGAVGTEETDDSAEDEAVSKDNAEVAETAGSSENTEDAAASGDSAEVEDIENAEKDDAETGDALIEMPSLDRSAVLDGQAGAIVPYADGEGEDSVPTPKTPSGIKAETSSATAVKVQWYRVEACEGYEVQSSSSLDFSDSATITATIDDSGETSYVFENLTCGEVRYYRVRAFVNNGSEKVRSAWSDVISICTSPKAPSSLTIEALTATSVQLTWDSAEEASGYIITRDGVQIGKVKGGDKLTYKDTGLMIGMEYDYRVYSYKTVSGNDIQSVEYAECLDYMAVPPAPKNVEAQSAGINSIKIVWEKVTDVSGYLIYKSVDNGANYELVATIMDPAATSWTDTTDIVCGIEYRYYMRAYASDSIISTPSNYAVGVALPTAPTGVKAAYKSSTSIEVSWNAVKSITGYIIMSGDAKDNLEYLANVPASQTSYLDEELPIGQPRFYCIIAYVGNYDANYIAGSPSLLVSDTTRPAAPQEFKLTNASYNSIELAWNESEGADGYQVYRSTNGKSYSKLATVVDGEVTYLDESLKCGSTYWYKVRAFAYDTEDGVTELPGPYCEALSLQAKPSAPETITVERVEGKNQLDVSWDPVEGANGYRVYISTNEGSRVRIAEVNSKTLTASAKNLVPGNTYQVSVRAFRVVSSSNCYGEYIDSDKIKFEFDQPTGLKHTPVSMTSFKLSWDAIGGVSGYEVSVSGVDDPSYSLDQTVTKNSITISGLICGYLYSCKVRAYSVINGEKVFADEEKWSEPIEAYSSPTTPGSLTIHTAYDSVGMYLSWKKVSGCTGYIIERSVQKDGEYEYVATCVGDDNTEYTHELGSDEVGEKYYYRVSSYVDVLGVKRAGTPATSAQVQILLPRPTLTLTVESMTSVVLSWDPVDDAEGYYIFRSTNKNTNYIQIATVGADETEYTNTSLKTGTRYYYRVCAIADYNGMVLRGVRSEETSIVPSPLAPTGLEATPYAESVTLSWDKVPGASGYYVYRATGSGSYKLVKTVTSTSTTDSGLVCEREYNYKVAAYKTVSGKKVKGASSEPITTWTAVTETTGLTYSVYSSSKLKFTWSKVRNADGYRIYMADSEDGPFSYVTTVTSNSATVSGLSVGQYRYFEVRAYVVKSGVKVYGPYSEPVRACTVPSAPTGLKYTYRTSDTVTINWKKATGATGYKIYYRKASESEYTEAAAVTGNSIATYQITDLEPNTKYYFKVRSTCEDSVGDTIEGKITSSISVTTRK